MKKERPDVETFAQKIAQEEDAGTKAINDKYGVPTKGDFDFKIFNGLCLCAETSRSREKPKKPYSVYHILSKY